MKKIFCGISLYTVIFLIAGCKKSDTPTSAVSSKADLLTKQDWNLAGLLHRQVNGTVWTDDLAGNKPCQKDDRVIFRSNYTLELNEGPTKCNASDPQIEGTGFWNFAENETVLVLKDAQGVQKIYGSIQTLTASSLKYSVTQTEQSTNITYEFDYSWVH